MTKTIKIMVFAFFVLCLIIAIMVKINLVCLSIFGLEPGFVSCEPTNKPSLGIDAKNATYIIEGIPTTLVNGKSVSFASPGSLTKITTNYFGNEVVHDLNNDGKPDIAFILKNNRGGSGTFYYAVAALNTINGYIGSQGFLLGDRIAPQSTTMGNGTTIVFNYADRKSQESFAIPPSVGKSIWLKLDPSTMQFGEVAQNFEGEADPSIMTLGMKKWNWINTIYNNDTIVTPHVVNKFTLTLKNDGTFSATTDCNSVGGEYSKNGTSIKFSNLMSTLMYCEGSEEGDFTKMLKQVQNYHFTSKGELIFDLKSNSGAFIFR